MNVIAQLDFELAYYESAVQRFNHYTTRAPSFLSRILDVWEILNFERQASI